MKNTYVHMAKVYNNRHKSYHISGPTVSTPPTHQPHVNLSPSSSIRSPSISPSLPSESSKASSQVDKNQKKQKEKKRN
jgi:hypothetical protein